MNTLHDDIRDAHAFVANLIANGHLAYLPLFERLEKEVNNLAAREALIQRAKMMTHQKKATRDNHSAF